VTIIYNRHLHFQLRKLTIAQTSSTERH